MELGESVNEPKLSVGFLTLRTDKNLAVRRTERGASIEFGPEMIIRCDIETARALCAGLADVLDEWYEERDRKGKA